MSPSSLKITCADFVCCRSDFNPRQDSKVKFIALDSFITQKPANLYGKRVILG
jgi:hypothetical protein